MKSRHHNTFRELEDLDTAAVPLTTLLELMREKLTPTAAHLYLYLLEQARIKNYATVRVHTGDLLLTMDTRNKALIAARKQLQLFKLVQCAELTKRGIWEYELLDPKTGCFLPARENRVEFANLSDWVVREFYMRQMPDRWDAGRGKFHCPFIDHGKATFRVKYALGTDLHGMWNCNKCSGTGGSGGMITFFARLYKTTSPDATRKVRGILQGIIQEDDRRLREAAAEPAVFATPENSQMSEV
jgi:hypothetical protein